MATDKKPNEHDSSLPGFLGTVDSLISRFESFALAAGVLLMAANTIANVVGRFIFQHSIFFTEELNRLLRWKKRLYGLLGLEYGRGAAQRLLSMKGSPLAQRV